MPHDCVILPEGHWRTRETTQVAVTEVLLDGRWIAVAGSVVSLAPAGLRCAVLIPPGREAALRVRLDKPMHSGRVIDLLEKLLAEVRSLRAIAESSERAVSLSARSGP